MSCYSIATYYPSPIYTSDEEKQSGVKCHVRVEKHTEDNE